MTLNTGGLQKAEKSTTIDFPIDYVKETVMKIFNSPQYMAKFMTKNGTINEVFNTYQFTICQGLLFGVTNMTLESVGDKKTRITLIVTNAHGQNTANSILEGMGNDYLLVLGKALSGQSVEEIKKTTNTSGCASVIAIFIMIGGLAGGVLYYFVA